MSSVVKEDKCEAFTIRFDGFEGLPARKGRDKVHSPLFDCFGHKWCVRIYPGGTKKSGEGCVSLYLYNCSPGSIEVQTTFTVPESQTKFAAVHASARKYQVVGEDSEGWGRSIFAQRSAIIGALKDGALIIKLQMTQTGPSSFPQPPFVPTNPAHTNTLKKFGEEESSDVIFEVSGDEVEEGGRVVEGGSRKRKRDEVPSTTFHAHRFVLLDNAPALAEACESSSDLTPIPITGVSPEIFRHVLYYLYGGKIDDDEFKENAKDIIDAADKFGVVGMKLAAEAAFVGSTTITMSNVMENLLYADAKNCPLLKEAVMDFLVQNGDESAKQLSFDNVPGSLMRDLLTAMNQKGKKSGGDELCAMRVSELRKELDEKGLEVDGSREAMIAALDACKSPDEIEREHIEILAMVP